MSPSAGIVTLAVAWAGVGGVAVAPLITPRTGLMALAASLAGLALLVATASRRAGMAIAGVAPLLILGLVRGSPSPVQDSPQRPLTLIGTVRETVGGGAVVDVDVSSADPAHLAGATVYVPTRTSPVEEGERVEVSVATLRAPSTRPGPTGITAMARLGVTDVATGAQITRLSDPPVWDRVLAGIRTDARHTIDSTLSQPAAALLLGIAFGLHEPIESGVRSSLQDAGLIHIVAVSGLKVVIVASLLGSALLRLPVGRGLRRALILGGVAVFVIVSGSGPAAVRSGLTATAALLLGRDGRRPLPFVVLGGAASLMLLLTPRWRFDAGFQLSVLGTAGILLLADPIARRLPGPRLLVEPFAVTVAAQLATVPVMASNFGSLALLGPVANALVLPFLPILIVLAWAGVALAPLGLLAAPILDLGGTGCDAIEAIAQAIASIPGAAIHIPHWPPIWTGAEAVGLGAATAIAVARRHSP
jgi:competence protein ComEC